MSVPEDQARNSDLDNSSCTNRITKIFRMGERRIRANFDLFNIFNGSAALAWNNSYGPNWQKPSNILQGRLIKSERKSNSSFAGFIWRWVPLFRRDLKPTVTRKERSEGD